MGSWSNSLHVKADSIADVVAAIRVILGKDRFVVTLDEPRRKFARTASAKRAGAEGDEPTVLPFHGQERDDADEPLDDDLTGELDEDLDEDDDDFDDDFDADDGDFDEPPDGDVNDRRLIFTETHNGWIGVLDNDFGGLHALAGPLSARLHTDVMAVCVNDSDAWYYVIHRDGRQWDEFDSSGGSCDDDGEISPELAAAMERGDEEEVERLVEKELWAHAPQGPINMPDGSQFLPPELAQLRALIASGKATWWQRLRCRWLWVKFLFKLISGRCRPHGMAMGFDIPLKNPLDADTLDQHLARLAEVFPRMDREQLRRLLPVSRFPAEDLLADFLRFVGLPKLYAYLSYDYLEDFGTGELKADGIRLAHELRLER
jgi:hypothetical protein